MIFTAFIAQINTQGRMVIYGEQVTEVTSVEQVKAIVRGGRLALSSTLEFAAEYTADPAVIALAKALMETR